MQEIVDLSQTISETGLSADSKYLPWEKISNIHERKYPGRTSEECQNRYERVSATESGGLQCN